MRFFLNSLGYLVLYHAGRTPSLFYYYPGRGARYHFSPLCAAFQGRSRPGGGLALDDVILAFANLHRGLYLLRYHLRFSVPPHSGALMFINIAGLSIRAYGVLIGGMEGQYGEFRMGMGEEGGWTWALGKLPMSRLVMGYLRFLALLRYPVSGVRLRSPLSGVLRLIMIVAGLWILDGMDGFICELLPLLHL